MSRPLPLLVLLAAPLLLTACDAGKSTLLNAKPGECYSVVGRDGLGAPKLAKTPCATSTAALSCPPAAAASCPGIKDHGSGYKAERHKIQGHSSVWRRSQARNTVKHRVAGAGYARYEDSAARSGEVASSLGIDYARVDSDLLGGAHGSSESYGHAQRYEREEQAYHEERREERYAPPPPRGRTIHDHASREREQRSYSYGESSSYSSHGLSSSRGVRGCDCGGVRARDVGPHSSIDGYGYLTWPGKTPG